VLSLTPFYRTFFGIGLTGNVVGLTIVHTFYAILLAVLIFRSFLVNFPREIREAAMIDGVGEWRALFFCIAPNVWGGMFATFVLALIQSWNEFLYALVLVNGDNQTVPVTIAGFLSFFGTNWGRLTAAGVIGALPIVIFAVLVRKHMARGLSFGGVK
jgi:ABC-type glycerol-3-phosphate transport system permease component